MTIPNIICKINDCHQYLGYLSAEYKNIFHRLYVFVISDSFGTHYLLGFRITVLSERVLKHPLLNLISTRCTLPNTVTRITRATNPNKQTKNHENAL